MANMAGSEGTKNGGKHHPVPSIPNNQKIQNDAAREEATSN